jgi:hypothetical protein
MKRPMLERMVAERISIAMQVEGCESAHIDPLRGLRIDEDEIELARRGTSSDPRYAVMIAYDHRSIASPPRLLMSGSKRCAPRGSADRDIADMVGLVAGLRPRSCRLVPRTAKHGVKHLVDTIGG